MSFNPNSVSLDEYNATLRGSVNAYYVHAMNDPTISREDAIKFTAEMSEKYLDAVEEFQESQGMQATNSLATNEEAQSVETNGAQTDFSTLDPGGIADDTTGGIGDDNSGGIGDDGSCDGIDNDGGGIDDGLDI